MAIKAYYKTPADISFYFRDKDSIKDLLEFIIKEATLFADEIDKSGNQIPYPIIVDENTYKFQIDYQFMIHSIAKYIANKTDDNSNYRQVLKHFSINKQSVGKGSSYSEKNRFLLTFIMEYQNSITQLSNLTKPKNSERWIWRSGYVNAQKLIKFNNECFEFKAVTLLNSDKVGEQKIGPYKYLGANWEVVRERFRVKTPPFQVAFGGKIKEYCSKNEIKKWIYFNIDLEFITGFIDYEMASKIKEVDNTYI
jgi:hypothetical protein